MAYEIKVNNCFSCPFKSLDLPTHVGNTVKYNRLSCHHPSFADGEIFATIMIEGEDLKMHKIFDCCPLKNHSVNVSYKDTENKKIRIMKFLTSTSILITNHTN